MDDIFVLSDSDSGDLQRLDVDSLVQMTEDAQTHEDALAASQITSSNQLDGDDDRPNSVTSSYLSDSEEEIDVGTTELPTEVNQQRFRSVEELQELNKKCLNEKKRRDALRNHYTRIKTWLPAGQVYSSKNSILNGATSFISTLKKSQYQYECVVEKLFQKNWRLKRRLKRLQSANAVTTRG